MWLEEICISLHDSFFQPVTSLFRGNKDDPSKVRYILILNSAKEGEGSGEKSGERDMWTEGINTLNLSSTSKNFVCFWVCSNSSFLPNTVFSCATARILFAFSYSPCFASKRNSISESGTSSLMLMSMRFQNFSSTLLQLLSYSIEPRVCLRSFFSPSSRLFFAWRSAFRSSSSMAIVTRSMRMLWELEGAMSKTVVRGMLMSLRSSVLNSSTSMISLSKSFWNSATSAWVRS